MFKYTTFYMTLLSFFVLSGCSDIDNTGANTVNANSGFISAETIEDINTSTMLAVVKGSIDANATNAFGYKAVKIVYKTQDMSGNDVNASGLLVIPSATSQYQAYRIANGQTPFSVSMICDNHGTIFTDAEAPSNVEVTNGLPDYTLAVLMSGYAGFAAVLPDYVGYGTSNSSAHPYMLKELSAQNSLDMIKASIKYMQDNGVLLNYQLYISGYSQGGHVAMALAEKIENEIDIVDLKGVAPMAGAHNIEALANLEINASRT
ncbi:MAG: lipase family protein, partial [Thiovulaceae bacterium]|nr:lipase family protein [Sulfurimonadaceae bacterium]